MLRRGPVGLGLVAALLLAAPAFAVPKVVSLGGDATTDKDPVAVCGSLAAAPWEDGWQGPGLDDKEIFLDGALTACEAALKASPDSAEVKAWLARVYLLVGRSGDAEPLLNAAANDGNALSAYLLSQAIDAPAIGFDNANNRSVTLLKQAADAGFVPAMNDLAGRFETANGVDQDPAEALRLYQLSAGKGSGYAIFKLGEFNLNGVGVTQDFAQAAKLYQQAADAGEPLGYDGLGRLYQNGQGVTQDYAKAAEIYQKGADKGEPQAETDLAYLYEQGLGVTKDFDKSLALLTDAANQNYGYGQAALAIHYLYGEGVEIDVTRALDLASAAEQKHVLYAEGILGYMYAEGLGTDRDLSAAEGYFQTGSDGGDKFSSDRLAITKLEIACEDVAGSQYEPGGTGHGVDYEAIDTGPAIEACTTALNANPNSVGDKVWLGRAYAVAGQYKDAVPLLQAGVDAGNALAQVTYAHLLLDGKGMDADQAGAVKLYRAAADKDFPLAQYALGAIYANGIGVEADVDTARQWYGKALDNGIKEARTQLAALQPSTASPIDMTGFGREGPAY